MSKVDTVVRGVLVQVSTRQVGQKNTTMWEIKTPDGTKWITFQAGLGNKAMALNGQVCDLKCSIEQNGEYTNYYLNGIQAGSPVADAVANAAGAAAQREMTFQEFSSQEDEKLKAKNDSIHRQTATKVAAALAPKDASEFWNNVSDLVHFYATGENPLSTASNPTQGDQQGADDDIPF